MTAALTPMAWIGYREFNFKSKGGCHAVLWIRFTCEGKLPVHHRRKRTSDYIQVDTHPARCFKEWLGPLVKRKLMVVVEAPTLTGWVVEQLRKVGAEVVVVDPRRVRLIAETRRKNDRADARVLAELARTEALPPPLPLPSEQARVLRARLVVRRGFVAQRSAILCRAGALLRSVGIRISTRGLQRPAQWDKLLRRRDLPEWLVCLLRSH